jgi:hypothetical protein
MADRFDVDLLEDPVFIEAQRALLHRMAWLKASSSSSSSSSSSTSASSAESSLSVPHQEADRAEAATVVGLAPTGARRARKPVSGKRPLISSVDSYELYTAFSKFLKDCPTANYADFIEEIKRGECPEIAFDEDAVISVVPPTAPLATAASELATP